MGEKEFQPTEIGRLYFDGRPWSELITDEAPFQFSPLRNLAAVIEQECNEAIERSGLITTLSRPRMCLQIARDIKRDLMDARVCSLLITPPTIELTFPTADEAAEAFLEFAQSVNQFSEMFHDSIKSAIDISKEDHPKWWHYFRYSKKLRIRRKYQKLIMQYTGLAALPL